MPLIGPLLNKPIDLFQVLQCGLESKPDDHALVSDETRWSWRQLDETSDNLASNMLSIGLKAGDRVALLMPNRAALVIHYLACIKAGFVATPLNYRYMSPEIDHALGLARLRFSLPMQSVPEISPPAYIFFTSGSTGKPKGVTHSAETFGWMLATTIASLDLTPDDILLQGSSISHVGSLLATLSGLAVGARVDVARTFDGDELLPLLRNTRPTVLTMLPAALISLVRDHNAQADDFCSIRLCISGGDKVSAELEREFTDVAGFPIDEIYGMTEFGISNANPPFGLNKLGSVGPACAGYQPSIRDNDHQELPIGEEGGLWVKGPSEMIGYWDNPQATKVTFEDGWLDTGDIMRTDDDGYLWFCGRKKQIIVHDGSNICPQEVEEALLEHPAVDNAGVVGVHNLIHGENVRGYISLRRGATRPSSQEFIRLARARIGYKAPEEIEVLDEMPLNPTGKVDRAALKRLAAERHDASI
jgi:long-chain acyl-CoA synthetase